MSFTSEARLEKFRRVSALRQRMTVILENVHDPHNIGAVLRSCDAVGIDEVYILYTEDRLTFDRLNDLGSSSTGVKKWMQLHCFRDVEACFKMVMSKYNVILATHLAEAATPVYENDLTQNVAFLFGNEHAGLTEEALSYATGNILIPQMGMAQSLNISVACAVTIYEALRQRQMKGMYSESLNDSDVDRCEIYNRFVSIHEKSYSKKK